MNFTIWVCTLFLVQTEKCERTNKGEPITMKAYSPSGMRVTVPTTTGLFPSGFRFHANINKSIERDKPGDINGQVTLKFLELVKTMTYEDPNVKLNIGDTIYFSIRVPCFMGSIVYEGNWKVTELNDTSSHLEANSSKLRSCDQSISRIDDRSIECEGTVIFQDDFQTKSIEKNNNWVVEQYIPDGPDYEFVVYKKDEDVVFMKDDALIIKPKHLTNEEIRKNVLDLSDGCTRKTDKYCIHWKFLIQNPIESGRLVSNFSFQYGDIEIRAKLPSGDWIYPQIYLQGESNHKILIAYARGNEQLKNKDNLDISGSLLLVGPILSDREPQRSSKLTFCRGEELFSADFHRYRLKWTKGCPAYDVTVETGANITIDDKIRIRNIFQSPSEKNKLEFFVDNKKCGKVLADSELDYSRSFDKNVKLVIGVGVGGVSDFPDKSKSGNDSKPWRNRGRNQLTDFYRGRKDWLKTWDKNSQLAIDYVKISSV